MEQYIDQPWYRMLSSAKKINYNINYLSSVKQLQENQVLAYVMRSLDILEQSDETEKIKSIVRTVLQWSEVARAGTAEQRGEWLEKGYDLYSHNNGSADIYREWNTRNFNKDVYHLIRRRATIGQIIQGEVPYDFARELHDELSFDKDTLKRVIDLMEKCVIGAVRPGLYEQVKPQIENIIQDIINGNFKTIKYSDKDYIVSRLEKLHKNLTEDTYDYLDDKKTREIFGRILSRGLWYFDAAMNDFTNAEIMKIFQMIEMSPDFESAKNISFARLMNSIYRDQKGVKVINLFKKRIMEQFLAGWTTPGKANKHIQVDIVIQNDTLLFDFKFSQAATKLIEFCETVYDDETYNKAIFMLYDLFEFRRDDYDRFYNEEKYLATMDSGLSNKSVLLNYITGNSVLDVGPGGGSLIDLITEQMPDKAVFGIDLSENVVRTLVKKKSDQNKTWNIIKGNALELDKHLIPGSIDTIIYSSIIHELYSYIETDGKKFNLDTVKNAIDSAYDVLPIGGRVIVRDGIKTEPENQYRIIEFKNPSDIEILKNYCKDFRGRDVTFESAGPNRVKMLVNDAMEFLYTYTWGPDSYALEVKEQFGYFTPTGWTEFVNDKFKDKFRIIELKHFLQDGYEENILPKIGFFNEDGTTARLPDSTCILVMEKIG